MREYNATVGATDGNIIAAIMTTQTPMNQLKLPRPVHGPLSIPRICWTVHHQPMAARASRVATSPSRPRVAANAGRRPARAGACDSTAVIGLGDPREVRLRQSALACVLDAE